MASAVCAVGLQRGLERVTKWMMLALLLLLIVALAIFGSSIGCERALLGEAVNVAVLDTLVEVSAGLIVLPAIVMVVFVLGLVRRFA